MVQLITLNIINCFAEQATAAIQTDTTAIYCK
jgi:hypothetical protein